MQGWWAHGLYEEFLASITGLCFSKDPVPGGHSFASGSSFAQNF